MFGPEQAFEAVLMSQVLGSSSLGPGLATSPLDWLHLWAQTNAGKPEPGKPVVAWSFETKTADKKNMYKATATWQGGWHGGEGFAGPWDVSKSAAKTSTANAVKTAWLKRQSRLVEDAREFLEREKQSAEAQEDTSEACGQEKTKTQKAAKSSKANTVTEAASIHSEPKVGKRTQEIGPVRRRQIEEFHIWADLEV